MNGDPELEQPESDTIPPITGTLVWYYYVCQREVWLMSRQINPDEADANMDLGRFLHETAYSRRTKRELQVGHIKLDIVRWDHGIPVIGEIKKSSRHLKSASMQLAFYLWELKQRGVPAKGELLFPKEHTTQSIILTPDLEAEIQTAITDIQKLLARTTPPSARKIGLCAVCAYAELCWA